MWSTGEGNGKPLQYYCLENPMNSKKRQKDMILKDELPRSAGAQYATGEEWRNNPRKNEERESKQKQRPVVDVTGDGSKDRCWIPLTFWKEKRYISWASLVAWMVKRLPTMWENRVQSLGREDPLEKEMAIHPSIDAGKSQRSRSLVGYSPWGRKESDTTERLLFTSLQ